MLLKLWQCRVIWYFFVGSKIIILSSALSVWFLKYVFLAKIWFVKLSTRIVKYESRVVKPNPARILKRSRHDFSGKHLCDGYCMDIMWCLCVEVKVQQRVIWFCKASLRICSVSLFECKGPWMLKTDSLKVTDSLKLVPAIFLSNFCFCTKR